MATMQSVHRPRKTVEDLRALPEDVRAELIDGEIYVSPSPVEAHQTAVVALLRAIANHADAGAGGKVYVAPFDVHLPTGDVVQPDVMWISPERIGIVKDWVFGVPDLLVEILSPSNPERDRIVKFDRYAMSGVREYWIADPRERGVEVFTLEGGRFAPAGWFRPGQRLVSRILPGLSIAIDGVFPPRT